MPCQDANNRKSIQGLKKSQDVSFTSFESSEACSQSTSRGQYWAWNPVSTLGEVVFNGWEHYRKFLILSFFIIDHTQMKGMPMYQMSHLLCLTYSWQSSPEFVGCLFTLFAISIAEELWNFIGAHLSIIGLEDPESYLKCLSLEVYLLPFRDFRDSGFTLSCLINLKLIFFFFSVWKKGSGFVLPYIEIQFPETIC